MVYLVRNVWLFHWYLCHLRVLIVTHSIILVMEEPLMNSSSIQWILIYFYQQAKVTQLHAFQSSMASYLGSHCFWSALLCAWKSHGFLCITQLVWQPFFSIKAGKDNLSQSKLRLYFSFFFLFGRSQSKTLEYQNRCVSCHIWWSGWTQRWSPQYSMYLRTVSHSFSSFSCFLCFPFLSFHFPHHLMEPINMPFGFLKNIKIEMQCTASLGLGQFHCILLSLVVFECCYPLNIFSKFSL